MRKDSGFTLVEILVTVTILAILATVILVTLNPMEISRKVKDVNKKTDVNALLFAIDTYFLNTMKYPWGEIEAEFYAEITDERVGICDSYGAGISGCTNPGILISNKILRDSFTKKKAFWSSAAVDDKLFVVSPEGELPSICFVPSSKKIRDTWNNPSADLRVLDFSADETLNSSTTSLCRTTMSQEPDWSSLTEACFECIPLKPME